MDLVKNVNRIIKTEKKKKTLDNGIQYWNNLGLGRVKCLNQH